MFKTIDLFAGAGGLSYGFEATGQFKVVAAAENNKEAADTYKANHLNIENALMINDVRGFDFKELVQKLNGIDVVIGGPPCQGFSNANRQKNHIISMNNSLVKEFFRAIKEINPKAFVMENVSMLSSKTHRFYDSRIDHDAVEKLNVEMRQDRLVIADLYYRGIDCYRVLNCEENARYKISDELLQLLNVLYKDRKSKEERLPNFVKKKRGDIQRRIEQYSEEAEHYPYIILQDVSHYLQTNGEELDFEELGSFIKFQKSFRLIDELQENEIIYELYQDKESNAVVARVHSYSVIDYVNKILGNEYVKNSGVINALWYGVPQERKRFIMIGIRSDSIEGEEINMPDGEGNMPSEVTVGQAIMDLSVCKPSADIDVGMQEYGVYEDVSEYAKKMREGSSGVFNHIIPKSGNKVQERFNALEEGENFHKLSQDLKDNYANPERTQNSIYQKLDRDKPSGTVINVRKSMWAHPTEKRAISIREAARLQSFPDKFIFQGSKNSQYQQVGNAVPPLMAQGIAEILLKYIKE